MQGLYAIYRKELSHYFASPVAYAVIGVFALVCAFVFNTIVSDVVRQAMQMQMQGGSAFDMATQVVEQYLMFTATLVLFFVPMLTMGVYSEERKRGTMELLMTSPVTETQIVIGKFCATLTVFLAMLIITIPPVIFVYFCSNPRMSIRVVLVAYLGVLLLGASLVALGTFLSSLTESQIIAAVLTFAVFLMVWIIDGLIPSGSSAALTTTMGYLSVIRHLQDFVRGTVDTSGLIYYLSFIFFFAFLTVRSVDSLRWRNA